MTIKNKDVANAFLNNRTLSNNSLLSTGDRLFSYETCIAQWLNGRVLLGNSTKYSMTTSHHLGLIKNSVDVWTTIKVPMRTQFLTDYTDYAKDSIYHSSRQSNET